MQTASTRIWTRVSVFFSYDGNHYPRMLHAYKDPKSLKTDALVLDSGKTFVEIREIIASLSTRLLKALRVSYDCHRNPLSTSFCLCFVNNKDVKSRSDITQTHQIRLFFPFYTPSLHCLFIQQYVYIFIYCDNIRFPYFSSSAGYVLFVWLRRFVR